MAKSKSKDLDAVLCGHILAMIGVLNVFLDEELGYTWMKASVIVAKSQGYGITRAWSIWQWVLTFLSTHKLPVNQYGWSWSSVLEDEDISQAIQFALGERGKSGVISATDLVDIVASLEMQEWFWQAGINKPLILEQTAHRWLGKLGWRYGRHQNSMYIDGHECEDVVEYWQAFVDQFAKYKWHFHLWDDDGNELKHPSGFPVPGAIGCFWLILITHDKSMFFQNDQQKIYWNHTGNGGAPKPKGKGQSLMVSDFLTADWGRLRDDNRCVFSSSP